MQDGLFCFSLGFSRIGTTIFNRSTTQSRPVQRQHERFFAIITCFFALFSSILVMD